MKTFTFTFTKLWRTLLLAAVLAVGAVCMLGCNGGADNPGGSGGNNTDGSNTGGNNTGGSGGKLSCGNRECRTVKIGDKTWMAENLNVETDSSWCYGEDGPVYDTGSSSLRTLSPAEIQDNCNKYGRLYTKAAAQKACPSGWHLPSLAEWDRLMNETGGPSECGKKLKSTSGWGDYSRQDENGNWIDRNGNGTDEFGFSALPGGARFTDRQVDLAYDNRRFDGVGYVGYWWIGINGSDIARYIRASSDNGYENYFNEEMGLSVRCVKND